MLKGKFAVLSLAAAALLCLQIAGVDTANSGNVSPCNSSATAPTGAIFACPYGDGDALNILGLTISVTVLDNVGAGNPVPGVPATDMWLISCSDLLNLCNGSSAITAAAATDINGNTTFTGDIAAGGCDNGGVRVVVQGIPIGLGCAPDDPCVPVAVRSNDFNANGICTDSQDFGYFTFQYPVNPVITNQDMCRDFDDNGVVDVVDFAKYTGHYDDNNLILHRCN